MFHEIPSSRGLALVIPALSCIEQAYSRCPVRPVDSGDAFNHVEAASKRSRTAPKAPLGRSVKRPEGGLQRKPGQVFAPAPIGCAKPARPVWNEDPENSRVGIWGFPARFRRLGSRASWRVV